MRFVLVHGALHGAWCWDRVLPEIKALGHQVVAVDLPGAGGSRDDEASMISYRDAVLRALRAGDVLVGHSMGCVVATLAADELPAIAHIVYLAGPLPLEGRTVAELGQHDLEVHGTSDVEGFLQLTDDGGSFTCTQEAALEYLYGDCPDDIASWAIDRLSLQPASPILGDPISVSRFWEAAPPRSFIRCADDRAFPAWQSDLHIRRLGVAPLTIGGSHSPFLSRPAELARLLTQAAITAPIGPLSPT